MLTVTRPRIVPGPAAHLQAWARGNAALIFGVTAWALAMLLVTASADPATRALDADCVCAVSP